MYQEDDNQTRQKGKAGSGIEDVSSSGLEKSKEVLGKYSMGGWENIRWINHVWKLF